MQLCLPVVWMEAKVVPVEQQVSLDCFQVAYSIIHFRAIVLKIIFSNLCIYVLPFLQKTRNAFHIQKATSRTNQSCSGMRPKREIPSKVLAYQVNTKELFKILHTFLVHIVAGQSGSLGTGFASGFPWKRAIIVYFKKQTPSPPSSNHVPRPISQNCAAPMWCPSKNFCDC